MYTFAEDFDKVNSIDCLKYILKIVDKDPIYFIVTYDSEQNYEIAFFNHEINMLELGLIASNKEQRDKLYQRLIGFVLRMTE